ncbi:hypothetical protein R4Z10_10965 [Niallia sp. XMNu-256]|uniref:hypothetical protein n=1 Tax=Niallia sp. XMNu-256 TaxID=3082444 RepID=UPI0030CF6CB4
MEQRQTKGNQKQNESKFKNQQFLQYEKVVELGLWTQVIGQFIEIKGLSGLLSLEKDESVAGEQQILTGVWIKTIGQILEAISVSKQIRETDIIKRLEEQKVAITGDLLVAIGAALEVDGGIRVLREEKAETQRIVP